MSDEEPGADLRDYLNACGTNHTGELAARLSAVWGQLADGDAHGMEPRKLSRIEDPSWDAPTLSFTIERHGGTVSGSS